MIARNVVLIRDGAQGRNRTTDTRIFSPLLYRLSYLGITLYVVALSLLRILAMLRIAPLLIPASNQRLLSFRLRWELTLKIVMAATSFATLEIHDGARKHQLAQGAY